MAGNTIYKSKKTTTFQCVLKREKFFHCWRLSQVEFTPTRKELLIRAYSIFETVVSIDKMFPELHVLMSYAIGYWVNYFNLRSFIKLSGKYPKTRTTVNCSHSHIRKAWKTLQVYFISYLAPDTPLRVLFFFETELQDESFDVITESASSSGFVFTCIYQERYRKKTSFRPNYTKSVPKFYHTDFLVILFLADQIGAMISQKVNTRGIDFVNFREAKFSFLNITALVKRVVENSLSCAFSCLKNLACFSFNLAAFPDKAGKFTCEILTSDKYNNSENFLPSKTFHHFSIEVRIICLN